MKLKAFKPILLFLITISYITQVWAGKVFNNHIILSDSTFINSQYSAKGLKRENLISNCYDINWATWGTFNDVSSTTGTIKDGDGTQIDIQMSANYTFGSTPSIYTYSKFNNYPSNIPNSTVPKTTWSAGTGGTTTMCFSKKVTNPVLLLSSLSSSLPTSSRLEFSIPYVVLYDGGGMVYNSSTAITGTEGYAIIMFPGDFTCITINSNTQENYTNLTWGIRPQPFTVSIDDVSSTCGSSVVTATGGVTYQWNGGDTPDQATNTFRQSGTYLLTVTDASGCTTSVSKTITVNNNIAASITTFSIPGQTSAAVIDQIDRTIAVTMPPGTNLAALSPVLASGAGSSVSPASGIPQNFTGSVTYTVSNNCAVSSYSVNVTTLAAQTLDVCPGDQISLPGSVKPQATIKWQLLQNDFWADAPGTNTDFTLTTVIPENISKTTAVYHFRRMVADQTGEIAFDSYYNVNVSPATRQNIIASDNAFACFGEGNPVIITGNEPPGYYNGVTYRWEQSTNDANWQIITGADQQGYLHATPVTQKLFVTS